MIGGMWDLASRASSHATFLCFGLLEHRLESLDLVGSLSHKIGVRVIIISTFHEAGIIA